MACKHLGRLWRLTSTQKSNIVGKPYKLVKMACKLIDGKDSQALKSLKEFKKNIRASKN